MSPNPAWGTPTEPIAPHTMQLGDTVSRNGQNFVVCGVVRYQEDDCTWIEFALRPQGGENDALQYLEHCDDYWIWWTDRPELTGLVTADRQVNAADLGAFRREEEGTAHFTANGDTGMSPQGGIDYVTYLNTNDNNFRLSLERPAGEGDWEVSVGHVVSSDSLVVTRTA